MSSDDRDQSRRAPDSLPREPGLEYRINMEVIARELQLEVERRRDWEQHQEENIHKLMERQDSMNTRVTSIWAVCMFLAAAIPIGLTILGLLIK